MWGTHRQVVVLVLEGVSLEAGTEGGECGCHYWIPG